MIKTKILIIGAGIAGLTAANYLALMRQDFIVLESDKIGGRLNEIKSIENFPALGKVNGLEIVKGLQEQAQNFGVKINFEKVQTILKNEVGFEVKTDVENYLVEKIILATGNNKISMSILGEEKYVGSGVSYCAVCDGNFFKGNDVAVIGNNNVAIEEAIYLSNIVKKLYFICPEILKGDDSLLRQLKAKQNVEIIEGKQVNEIIGDDFGVTEIKVDDSIIKVSGVFPYVGRKNAIQILNNLHPSLKDGCLLVNENMESSVPGLFGAGDIVAKSLKQLITAASDGAIAAVNVLNNINHKS